MITTISDARLSMAARRLLRGAYEYCSVFVSTLSAYYVVTKYGVFLSRVRMSLLASLPPVCLCFSSFQLGTIMHEDDEQLLSAASSGQVHACKIKVRCMHACGAQAPTTWPQSLMTALGHTRMACTRSACMQSARMATTLQRARAVRTHRTFRRLRRASVG